MGSVHFLEFADCITRYGIQSGLIKTRSSGTIILIFGLLGNYALYMYNFIYQKFQPPTYATQITSSTSLKRKLAVVLTLSLSGCATNSGVGYAWFGTSLDREWGTGGVISSHYLSYTKAVVEKVSKEYCAKRMIGEPTLTLIEDPSLFKTEYYKYNFECERQTKTPVVDQQELTRFRAEAEAAKQRQIEEQFNQNRQQVPLAPSSPNGQQSPQAQAVAPKIIDRLPLETAKVKCGELGFKSGTEAFGKCVLQLSK